MDTKDTKSSYELEHQEEKGQIDTEGHLYQNDERNDDEHVIVTEEDSKRILRKTDRTILVILVWVYLLQIADKSTLGYASVFGLQKDANLVGTQYSMVGSIAAIAQLAWQPFSSYLIVRVPSRYLMTFLVLGWGLAQTFMCISKSYQTLLVTRFFLGLFEAGCLPLFSIITAQWYMRSEQPLRVAAWYGTNGLATIFLAALSYGLGHIKSDTLHSWQILFLFVGLLTVLTAPFVYWRLDSSIATARFLSEEDKKKAIERLRANQTGTGSNEYKWEQVWDALLDVKTWLWVAMAMLLNVGASVTNTFGPLILGGLGFDKYITSLLNMPFGAVQVLVILLSSWLAWRYKSKGFILLGIIVPVIAGLAILYSIGREKKDQGPLLVGYYLLGMLFGGNPLIVTWMIANTGGQTKKAVLMSLYNAGSSAGNIVGPLLFKAEDKPAYKPGLRIVLGLFIGLFAVVALQIVLLGILNKRKEAERVANGKPAKILDRSMEKHYVAYDQDEEVPEGVKLGQNALLDLTDTKNDEFVYVL